MSGKNQYPVTTGPSSTPPNQPGFSWQSTNPTTGFNPTNAYTSNVGSLPSGVVSGAMASTNTIYSQILDISRMDNSGLEVNWIGNPVGTFQVMVSNSGINFYALTFNPALTQPSGTASGIAVNLNQLPFKYMMLQYTNSSGTGTLTVYGQFKDIN